jgi:hypothetical protein
MFAAAASALFALGLATVRLAPEESRGHVVVGNLTMWMAVTAACAAICLVGLLILPEM